MLPEFCSLWGRNQQGILGRDVCSCLLEDREAAGRRAGSRQEPGPSFTSGLSGQFPASTLSTSCLSITVRLGWGMTLGPHVYTLGPIYRVSSASCRTHSAPGGVPVIHHAGRAERSSLTGHQRSALLCSFPNGFKH